MGHVAARGSLLGALATCLLVVPTAASASTRPDGATGAQAAGCLAHVIGNPDSEFYEHYTAGCTGHDEPELDPVSSAPGSARDITWHVALPAGATYPVSSVGPTFWFGGTVHDSSPDSFGNQGFLELQIYPDSFTKRCNSNGGFVVQHQPGVYTACSPVWKLELKQGNVIEPAAFNGMLANQAGTGPLIMHGRDMLDIHIWAPSMTEAYREQITDITSGETSSVLVLNSPTDGPLTPQFDTNEIGNSLDWGGVWDTPMAFVYEIGHSDIYGDHPGQFCLPGQVFCGSFNQPNWAGQQPLRIFGATFGDGSAPENWAVVSDTGGKAEVLGNSFVGPTECAGYGGPYCIYPWYSWDGQAYNYGVDYPNTVDNFGRSGQFAKRTRCPTPPDSPFPPYKTYCANVIQ